MSNGNRDKISEIKNLLTKYDFNDIADAFGRTCKTEFNTDIELANIKDIKECIWEFYSFVTDVINVVTSDDK